MGLRAFHALKHKVGLLNPFRYGIFAWQLFSHKVLRYMAFLFQVAAFLSCAFLEFSDSSLIWSLFWTAQIVIHGVAVFGQKINQKGQTLPRLAGMIYYL